MLGFFETTPLGVDVAALDAFRIDATPRDPGVLAHHAPGLMEVVPGLGEAPVVGGTAGADEHPLELHRALVDRPREADRGLAVGLEVGQQPRRGNRRDVDHEVHAILFHAERDGTSAVGFERCVPGAEMYAQTFLEEGRQVPVDHRIG